MLNRKGFIGTDELYHVLKMVAVLIVILVALAAIGKFLFGMEIFGW